MNSTSLKLIVAAFVFVSTLVCSLLPIHVLSWFTRRNQLTASTSTDPVRVRCTSPQMLISFMTCFGGGVFLGVCLLDLLPDVIHHINSTLKNEYGYDNEHEKDYPLGELLIALGFLTILFVEQAMLSFRSPATTSAVIPNKTSRATMSQADDNAVICGEETHQVSLLMEKESCSKIENQPNLHESKGEISSSTSHVSTSRNLLMIISLVIHSLFEGIALGSLNEYHTIMKLSLAILIHKSIISFSIGLKLTTNAKAQLAYLCCIIFSFATPLGVLIMVSMQELLPSNSATKIFNDILRAFACGTFFYITFCDVLPHELNISALATRLSSVSNRYRLMKTFFVLIGFICTGFLIFVTK
jgi:solute carrier family 39 (zinc transporter), member 1/2/3